MTLQREIERVQRSDLRKAHLHLPSPSSSTSHAPTFPPTPTISWFLSVTKITQKLTSTTEQTWRHGQLLMNSYDDNLLLDLRIKYRLQLVTSGLISSTVNTKTNISRA